MTGLLSAGVTGTRHPVGTRQLAAIAGIIGYVRPGVLHHGDCTGADAATAALARSAGARIKGHPPRDPRFRAFFQSDDEAEPLPYLTRNHVIVDEAVALIAVPRTMRQEQRSGTWATVRYALAQPRVVPVFYAWPDGSIGAPPAHAAILGH